MISRLQIIYHIPLNSGITYRIDQRMSQLFNIVNRVFDHQHKISFRKKITAFCFHQLINFHNQRATNKERTQHHIEKGTNCTICLVRIKGFNVLHIQTDGEITNRMLTYIPDKSINHSPLFLTQQSRLKRGGKGTMSTRNCKR